MQHAAIARPASLPLPRALSALSALSASAAITLALTAAPVQAAYPERPISIVVSFPAGGGTDVLARVIGAEMSKHLGQSIVIENRPGAGGYIGMTSVARASADGYTMYMAAITNVAIAASAYPSPSSDLRSDFVPVAGVATIPHGLVVPAGLSVNSVPELIAYLQAAPGKYNFASQGMGTLSHLESEVFLQKTGAQATHIPYKGSSQALPEVVNGSSVMMFDSITASKSMVDAGKLRYLAVASTRRMSSLPDVPTLDEAGLKGFGADNWIGLVAPKGTPTEAVAKVSAAVEKALQAPALIERLSVQGAELRYVAPAELGPLIDREHETWAQAVKAAGVKLQ